MEALFKRIINVLTFRFQLILLILLPIFACLTVCCKTQPKQPCNLGKSKITGNQKATLIEAPTKFNNIGTKLSSTINKLRQLLLTTIFSVFRVIEQFLIFVKKMMWPKSISDPLGDPFNKLKALLNKNPDLLCYAKRNKLKEEIDPLRIIRADKENFKRRIQKLKIYLRKVVFLTEQERQKINKLKQKLQKVKVELIQREIEFDQDAKEFNEVKKKTEKIKDKMKARMDEIQEIRNTIQDSLATVRSLEERRVTLQDKIKTEKNLQLIRKSSLEKMEATVQELMKGSSKLLQIKEIAEGKLKNLKLMFEKTTKIQQDNLSEIFLRGQQHEVTCSYLERNYPVCDFQVNPEDSLCEQLIKAGLLESEATKLSISIRSDSIGKSLDMLFEIIMNRFMGATNKLYQAYFTSFSNELNSELYSILLSASFSSEESIEIINDLTSMEHFLEHIAYLELRIQNRSWRTRKRCTYVMNKI